MSRKRVKRKLKLGNIFLTFGLVTLFGLVIVYLAKGTVSGADIV